MMFGLYTRLAAIAVLAVVLAGIGWKLRHGGVVAGRAEIQAQWDAETAHRTAAALLESEKARKREQELQTKVGRVDRAYQDQKRINADLAGAAADSLRELQAVLARPGEPASPAGAAIGAYGTGGLERELLGHCAAALAELGQTADRLESKVVGLQGYIQSIQVKP